VTLELDEDFDAANRELCPDGGCTGVLDERGVCKVCGAQGTPAVASAVASAVPRYDDDADEASAVGDDAGGDEASASDGTDALDDRQLCPDGGCIGLIGPDGKCKVCGRALA
jgi:hypothetical protein